MSLGLVIQARMGSTRLPGKVLKMIGERPLLGHIMQRLHQLHIPAQSVVATSDLPQDDAIADWCAAQNIHCFRGSERDVLHRYFSCAQDYSFENIVRLTGDNPFTDIPELERLIRLHLQGGYDYSHSFGQLPIGVGAEIFTFDALERSHTEGTAPHHREHVNEYILENAEHFTIGQLVVAAEKTCPTLRLTVDTPDDFRLATLLLSGASDTPLTTQEAIRRCLHSA